MISRFLIHIVIVIIKNFSSMSYCEKHRLVYEDKSYILSSSGAFNLNRDNAFKKLMFCL